MVAPLWWWWWTQAGYDWCAEQLRAAGLVRLANEVELAKASKFMATKEFEAAINVFKVRLGFAAVRSHLDGVGAQLPSVPQACVRRRNRHVAGGGSDCARCPA